MNDFNDENVENELAQGSLVVELENYNSNSKATTMTMNLETTLMIYVIFRCFIEANNTNSLSYATTTGTIIQTIKLTLKIIVRQHSECKCLWFTISSFWSLLC